MRVRSRSSVLVDLLTKQREVATIAAFASNLGYDVEINRHSSTDGGSHLAARLVRQDDIWTQEDIAALVVLYALGREITPRAALAQIERQVAQFGLDVDEVTPIFDRPAEPDDEANS